MKYALIVMLAVYLVTFGCNPKTEDENTASHDKPEQVNLETPAALPPAPPTNVHIKAESKEAEVQPTPEITEAAAPEQNEVPAESKGEEELNDQWKAIAQSAATTVLALMNEEPKEVEPTQPAKEEKITIELAEDKGAVLPCGKKATREDVAKRPHCMKHGAATARQPAALAEDTKLSEAMQRMVNATNNLLMVTGELVTTTQQMLSASKEVAVEVIDAGKEAMETSQPHVDNGAREKELIETVKEVVSATKEAFDATSAALSDALEAAEASPNPGAVPQQ